MRILFLTNFYPPYELGGLELRCSEVVTFLRERGHTVAVLTSKHGVQQPQHENAIYRLLNLQSDLRYYQPHEFFLSRRRREQENIHHLSQLVKEFQPDVLFVWGMWNLSRALPAYIEALGYPPIVYSIGDLWPAEPDVHTIYWQMPARHRFLRLPKRLLACVVAAIQSWEGKPRLRFEHVICVSQAVKNNLIQAGLPLARAAVIHGGIDIEQFQLSPQPRFWERRDNSLRLLYAGGLGSHKGVHTAIEALAILHEQLPDWQLTLTLIGGGHPDYETFLRDLATNKGVANHVVFQGRVPRSQIPHLFAQYDVFLFPSVCQEALPRAPMEAMASGLVVVGTTTGGTAEILVEGENALTFAPEDAQGLARQVERLVREPGLAQRLTEAGRQTVQEKFTLERMVGEMERYLKEIIGDMR